MWGGTKIGVLSTFNPKVCPNCHLPFSGKMPLQPQPKPHLIAKVWVQFPPKPPSCWSSTQVANDGNCQRNDKESLRGVMRWSRKGGETWKTCKESKDAGVVAGSKCWCLFFGNKNGQTGRCFCLEVLLGEIAWCMSSFVALFCWPFLFVEEFLCWSFHRFQNSSQNLVESKKPGSKNTSDVPVAEVVSALARKRRGNGVLFEIKNHHHRKEKTVWVFLNMNNTFHNSVTIPFFFLPTKKKQSIFAESRRNCWKTHHLSDLNNIFGGILGVKIFHISPTMEMHFPDSKDHFHGIMIGLASRGFMDPGIHINTYILQQELLSKRGPWIKNLAKSFHQKSFDDSQRWEYPFSPLRNTTLATLPGVG